MHFRVAYKKTKQRLNDIWYTEDFLDNNFENNLSEHGHYLIFGQFFRRTLGIQQTQSEENELYQVYRLTTARKLFSVKH